MKSGFTTGSCAAAGAKASAFMLFSGIEKKEIKILTPKGIEFNAKITDIIKNEKSVSCAVIKDGGDDPDVTTGAHVISKVLIKKNIGTDGNPKIKITGGIGVGVITKAGLEQKIGEPAINRIPRQMIEKEVLEVCNSFDFHGELEVEISVPEGIELAKKTFNPRLGIKGGISILGTSGIVEPMSTQAIIDTIKIELHQHKILGKEIAAITPGNYGQEFMLKTYGYNLDKSIKCSNFIGETIDLCKKEAFKKILLTGHVGKLIKVSGGIMNTHSKEGDCRMELMTAAAIKCGCSVACAKKILDCITTDEALQILIDEKILVSTMECILNRIMFYLQKRSGEEMEIACMVYSNQFGLLSKTKNADDMIIKCKKEI